MKKMYKKPNIYKINVESECMAPIILSNQSIGGNVDPIGGEGNVDDGADAKIFNYSLWEDYEDEEDDF